MKQLWEKIFALGGAYLMDLFVPIIPFLWLIVALLVIDRVTGVSLAIKHGEKITERKWLLTILKITLYFLGLFACRLCEMHLLEPGEIGYLQTFPLTWWLAFYIVVHELRSVWRNIGDHNGVSLHEKLFNIFETFKPKKNG